MKLKEGWIARLGSALPFLIAFKCYVVDMREETDGWKIRMNRVSEKHSTGMNKE